MTDISAPPSSPVPAPVKASWVMNLVAFQLGWWALVLTAAQGWSEIGLGVVALLLAWHLGRVRPLGSEALLIGLAALVGFGFDSLLLASGWVSFGGGELTGGLGPDLPPLWMTALWANFATTLHVSLVSLQIRPWLAALLGLVGGPAAYWGGAELGAMSFLDPTAGLIALALGWGILTPLLLALARLLSAPISDPPLSPTLPHQGGGSQKVRSLTLGRRGGGSQKVRSLTLAPPGGQGA
jgi:hypothetical protein